jgi:hypothetical protein
MRKRKNNGAEEESDASQSGPGERYLPYPGNDITVTKQFCKRYKQRTNPPPILGATATVPACPSADSAPVGVSPGKDIFEAPQPWGGENPQDLPWPGGLGRVSHD